MQQRKQQLEFSHESRSPLLLQHFQHMDCTGTATIVVISIVVLLQFVLAFRALSPSRCPCLSVVCHHHHHRHGGGGEDLPSCLTFRHRGRHSSPNRLDYHCLCCHRYLCSYLALPHEGALEISKGKLEGLQAKNGGFESESVEAVVGPTCGWTYL